MKHKKKKTAGRKRTAKPIRIGKRGKELELMDMRIRQAIPDKQKRFEYVQALGKYLDDTMEDVTLAKKHASVIM